MHIVALGSSVEARNVFDLFAVASQYFLGTMGDTHYFLVRQFRDQGVQERL
jgi:hypothetical protein